MASDGLWDRIDNKEALKIVREGVAEGTSPTDFAKKGATTLLKEAMIRGSTDNISIVIVGLPELPQFLNPTQVL